MRKPWPLGGVAALVLILVLLLLAALSLPMSRGATLWQAVAVLPQSVLWGVPILVAMPVLAALAFQVRPHWHRVRDQSREDLPTGPLRPLADALRHASDSRFSRSRVIARLVRLATSLAAEPGAVPDDEAWEGAQQRLHARAPHVAAFLRREESTRQLSRTEFRSLVEHTVTQLEREQEEM